MQFQSLPWSQKLIVLASVGLLFAALSFLPVLDYEVYANAARAWRDGSSRLYDSAVTPFFYAPWCLILLVPLSLFPDQIGQALLNSISLAGIIWCSKLLVQPQSRMTTVLTIATPYVSSLLLLGQWDGVVILGIALAWFAINKSNPYLLGAALMIIGSKPTNVLYVLLVLLFAIRSWPWQRIVATMLVPMLVLIASFWACGLDWPARYIHHIQNVPPEGYNVSLWTLLGRMPASVISIALGVWLFRSIGWQAVKGPHIAQAMLISLAVSPYVIPYHYVTLVPILACITQQKLRIGIALWAMGVLAFFAFILRWSDAPMYIYFVATLCAGLVLKPSQNLH